MSHIEIRVLQENDVEELVNDFNNEGVDRNKEYFQFCLDEMKNGVRVTFIACVDNHFVGTAHFLYHSNYPQFKSMDIPEINDLVVIPSWRRNSVGDKLLETLEVFAQSENYKRKLVLV